MLPRGLAWYQTLAEPIPQNPLVGTTVWSPPAGSVGVTLDGPPEPPMARNNAARLLENPEPSSPASIERGKTAYGAYCVFCHGEGGRGDGPIAAKLVFPPPNLPVTMQRYTDGYLYATIRNGGAIMPPQGYRTTRQERWDMVNYLRSIQQ